MFLEVDGRRRVSKPGLGVCEREEGAGRERVFIGEGAGSDVEGRMNAGGGSASLITVCVGLL